MATETPERTRIFERMATSAIRRRPTLSDLRSQAKEALREEEGIDLGRLTHVERNKIIFGI